MKSKIRAPDGMPGGILSLSANGDRDGVIWAALPLNEDAFIKTVRGVLRAFDATTLEELWNTEAAEPDDNFSFAKYCPPSVVNGKVYLATFSDRLNIYGMRAASGPPPPISRKRPPRGLHQRRKAEKH
jgi:outer membrane protein assembly factor BamB